MSEEEIIDKINYMINNWNRPVVEIDIKWIQGLLDLYNKEKEENRKLRKCHLMYEEMTGVDLLLEENNK